MSIESPVAVSLSDIANIVTFIAPGYFAIMIYSIRYAKTERSIPKLIVESIVWSLPLIAITNSIWLDLLNKHITAPLDRGYTLLLLAIAALAGFAFSWLRVRPPVSWIASRLGVDSPHEDFVGEHFKNLKPGDAVTVRLKSGPAFSGTPSGGSIYTKTGPRKYCFEYVAWYNEKTEKWEETDDTVMVDLREIEYTVKLGSTPKTLRTVTNQPAAKKKKTTRKKKSAKVKP